MEARYPAIRRAFARAVFFSCCRCRPRARFLFLRPAWRGSPSKRQPLPGTKKLWKGMGILFIAVTAVQACTSQDKNGKHGESGMVD